MALETHAAGGADIYTTEYIEQQDGLVCGYDRSCSLCGVEENQPLLKDQDEESKQLGRGEYNRLIARDGETNVTHFDKRSRKIVGEMGFMFHVLIGMRAWKLVILFFLSYFVSYLAIGGILWLTHDIEEFHGIASYWDAVVFIGYTMTTVGFGNQYPHTPAASAVPLISTVFALLMDSFWLGVIFARIATPRPLRHTILFSKQAVIHQSATQHCAVLACRVVNLRVRYPWVDMTIRMTLALWDNMSQTFRMYDLKVVEDAEPFLDVPWDIQHVVTNDSPLLRLIEDEGSFDRERGEIIVEMDGQDPLTGNCMKKRFSYIAKEVIRDYRFAGIMEDQGEEGYSVDLTRFHSLEPCQPTTAVAAVGYGTNALPVDKSEQSLAPHAASNTSSTNQL